MGETSKVVKMSGPIGESTPLFTVPVGDVTELVLDMADITYINSIGVKHWIIWTVRVPKSCQVRIIDCPLVIVSQANTVMGFLTPNMTIESFRLPYACEDCGHEEMRTVKRGVEYEYRTTKTPKRISLPPATTCPKCSKGQLEPDIFIEKVFKFLG